MRKVIDKYLRIILVFLLALITLDVLWGVFTRYGLNAQSPWTEELARFLLIWIGILGAAYASGRKMHLAIDLLRSQLSEERQLVLKYIINLFIIAFAATVMVIGGIRLIYISHTLGQISPALRIPMTIVYAVIPLSGLLVVYYKVNELSVENGNSLPLQDNPDQRGGELLKDN